MSAVREYIRDKYAGMRGVPTAERILELCDEHERMENVLRRISALFQRKEDENDRISESEGMDRH